MKNRLLIAVTLLFFTITLNLSAQTEWFPIGAKWQYGVKEGFWAIYDDYYITFEVMGDDIVNSMLYSKTCREILKTLYDINNKVVSSEIFTLCFNNNKVYYEDNGGIYLLYDFNTNKNGTWVTRINDYYNSDDELRTITVDSVSEMIISNDTLKVLYTSSSFSPYAGFVNAYFINPIIEKIGADYFFMKSCDFCYDKYLRCYIDSSISYSRVSFPCDTIIKYYNYSINSNIANNDLTLYPNPADNEINIKLQTVKFNTDYKILIFDLKGICYYSATVYNVKDKYKINTSLLANGGYILKIFSNNNIIQKKFTILR